MAPCTEHGLPESGYAADGTILPPAITRQPCPDSRFTAACNGGLPVARLTEICSTDLSLAVLLTLAFASPAHAPVLWIAADGSPAPLPPDAIHAALPTQPLPPILHLRPAHLESLPTPDDILRSLQPATPPSLAVIACLSAIPARGESLCTEPRTAHASPAGRFLDSVLGTAACPVVAIEPWHGRGPDLASGPPGPALRTAASALRIRIESASLKDWKGVRITVLHDRAGPSPREQNIRTPDAEEPDACYGYQHSQAPRSAGCTQGR